MMSEDQPKPKLSLLERFREWRWKRKYELAHRALVAMVNNKDPEIYKNLHECAEIMAKDMCMRWLDNKGLHHCAKCPNTERLLSVDGAYLCVGHARKSQLKINEPTLSVLKP